MCRVLSPAPQQVGATVEPKPADGTLDIWIGGNSDAALRRVADGVPFREAYRHAADDVDALDVPDDPLSVYRVDGYPGCGRPELVLEKLQRSSEWLP